MNYKNIYENLINRAKTRMLTGYKEKHHIIPKCLGGTDKKDNLVDLTPEEHFVAHQLLVKIYPENSKLIYALSKMMCNSHKNRRNNKWYGWIRGIVSNNHSGEKNPSAKFTNEQALEIYYSDEDLSILTERYNCNRYNIITIKRKIHYRNVTKDIRELPGFPEHIRARFPIPVDLIPDIFFDTGSYDYFYEKYRATPGVVKSIKSKRSFKNITSKLGTPGQIKRYKLTFDEVEEIINMDGSCIEIGEKYNINSETVRNIKKGHTRRYDIWDEF